MNWFVRGLTNAGFTDFLKALVRLEQVMGFQIGGLVASYAGRSEFCVLSVLVLQVLRVRPGFEALVGNWFYELEQVFYAFGLRPSRYLFFF